MNPGPRRRPSSPNSATSRRRRRSGPNRPHPAFPEIPVRIMLARDDAARLPAFLRGPGKREVNMGNAAVIEELAGSEELDELYRLDASESDPEDEPDDDEEQDDEDEGKEGIKPEGMPHD